MNSTSFVSNQHIHPDFFFQNDFERNSDGDLIDTDPEFNRPPPALSLNDVHASAGLFRPRRLNAAKSLVQREIDRRPSTLAVPTVPSEPFHAKGYNLTSVMPISDFSFRNAPAMSYLREPYCPCKLPVIPKHPYATDFFDIGEPFPPQLNDSYRKPDLRSCTPSGPLERCIVYSRFFDDCDQICTLKRISNVKLRIACGYLAKGALWDHFIDCPKVLLDGTTRLYVHPRLALL